MMKRLLASLLFFICLPALADVTWFWRFEGTTLDGTHDHANGSADTTATINGSASLSATAARVGSNGGLFGAGTADQFRFDTSTDMANRLEGALALSIRIDTAPSGLHGVLSMNGTAGGYAMFIVADEVRVYNNIELPAEDELMTAAADMTEDVWYGIVFRWDNANNLRRIEVYDASGVEVESVEESTAWTAPDDLANTSGLRIGNTSGGDGVIHIDNVFIADSYDEPLQNNFTIASFTSYDGTIGGGGDSIVPIIMQQH